MLSISSRKILSLFWSSSVKAFINITKLERKAFSIERPSCFGNTGKIFWKIPTPQNSTWCSLKKHKELIGGEAYPVYYGCIVVKYNVSGFRCTSMCETMES